MKTEMSLTFGLIICVHFETLFRLILIKMK